MKACLIYIKGIGLEPPIRLKEIVQNISNKTALLVVVAALASIWAVQIYVVNDTDNEILNNGIARAWSGENPWEHQNLSDRNEFYSPPHALIWLVPFVIWGPHVASALNVFFILLLVTRLDNPPFRWANCLLLFNPALLFVIATGNVVGITAGLGLLIIFARQKGWRRGMGWALLALRPQDAFLVVVVDGLLAIRERDWPAIAWGLLFVSPSIIFGPLWLSNIPHESPLHYTLATSAAWGWPIGLVVAATALAPILFLWLPPREVLKKHWPLVAVLVHNLLITNYISFYMIWLMMLTLREMSSIRAIIHFIVTFIILAMTMTTLDDPNRQAGYVGVVLVSTWLLIRPNMIMYWWRRWREGSGLVTQSSE